MFVKIRNVILVFLGLIKVVFAQEYCSKIDLMYSIYNRFHIEGKLVDNAFKYEVRRSFLQELDPYNFILTKEDQSQLLILSKDCDFVGETVRLFAIRVNEFDSISSKILESKLNLNILANLTLFETIDGSVSELDKKNRVEQVLKYMVLKDLFYEYDYLDTDSFKMPNQMEVQKDVSERLSKRLARKSQDFNQWLLSCQDEFLNSIGHQFDPHSGYFSTNKKEDFENSLSKEIVSFGLSFGENDEGNIIVRSLMPGGPAWKTGEVHIGNEVLEIKIRGKSSKKTTSMSARKANSLLKEAKGGKVELVLKSQDGKVFRVHLQEESTEVESNIISSFILKGEKKFGYIELPGFYTDYAGLFGLGCANDVAKELMKLQKEGVEGVILDLRYNGGGSLKEALDLAGIFIDEGPFVVLNKKYDKPRVQKDRNRGAIYKGPLTVMVNGASASASEILSKIFQDYNRAIIAGGTTYGKATAQNIIPLDTSSYTESLLLKGRPNEELGYTKITLSKIYGVDLNTYQKNGVKPDVKIPYYYDGLIPKESDCITALSADKVEKNIYNFTPLKKLPITELKSSSESRILNDSIFKELKKLNIELIKLYENFEIEIPVSLKEYKTLLDKRKVLESKIDLLNSKLNPAYKVLNTEFEKEIIKLSEYSRDRNQRIINALNQDIELNEAFLITQELININK